MIPGRPVRALIWLMNDTTQLRTWVGVRLSVTSRSRVICRSPVVGRTTSQNRFACEIGSEPGWPKWYAPRTSPTDFMAAQLVANVGSVYVVPSVALQKANFFPLFLTLVQLIDPCQCEMSIPWMA